MKTSTALLLAGGVGAALYLIEKSAVGSSLPATKPTAPKVTGGQVDFGPVVGPLKPFYAITKPIADKVTTPIINGINHAIGGVNPWGAPSKPVLNANGEYVQTDGTGATITYHADGSYTRKNPNFSQTTLGKPLTKAYNEVKSWF